VDRVMALLATLVAAITMQATAMAGGGIVPALVAHSHWMKACTRQGAEAKTICSTGAEVWDRVDSYVVADVEIVEPEGAGKQTLRVTFPPDTQLVPGTRLTIDGNALQRSPYLGCSKAGCVSEYEISPEMMNRIKTGGTLRIQAIDKSGTELTASLPLADFAEAYDGLPSDPQEIEEERLRNRRWLDDRRARPSPFVRPPGR
jgi:invasion protein IalB